MRDAPSAKIALATTFGLGHMRPFPGTWGSIPPVVLAALLILLQIGPAQAGVFFALVMWVVALVFTAVCVFATDVAAARFGRSDPSQIVADETAGMALTLALLPASAFASGELAVFTLFYAFVAFRVFDILKPWPAGALQHVPGAWGVVLDDLAAAVMAAIVVWIVTALTL